MSTKINSKKVTAPKIDTSVRLAGGMGNYAALQGDEARLRRLVLANLLWENLAYVDGKAVAEQIKELIPDVAPETVAKLAVEARKEQKLRHTPLFIAREMFRYPEYKKLAEAILPEIITRADMITDFLALYSKDSESISHGVRRALENAFRQFKSYHFAKYAGNRHEWSMSDAIRVIHPKPLSEGQSRLFKDVRNDALPPADTWEVALSTGKDAKETWERLITEGKLGALAFLRNLRNMEKANVQKSIILQGFESINPGMLLPINFFAAAKSAPYWSKQIEDMMLKSLGNVPKLSGTTVLIDDVSGSMHAGISEKSDFNRLAVAGMMTAMAKEICQFCEIWATAGSDFRSTHQTREITSGNRGFNLANEIVESENELGGGGIFTRQVLNYIRENKWQNETPDRVIVFSDSQDCDRDKSLPKPFGKWNYIVDVSAHQHGVNYKGVWNGGEVSGWSEKFLSWIAANEGVNISEENESE